jgi:hypothetical protein
MLYVDMPNARDIASLVAVRAPVCLSIYLKTTPVTHEIEASKIQFSNLARQAMDQLAGQNLPKSMLNDVQELLDEVLEDDNLWRYQANTLAIFVTPDSLRTFRLANHIESRLEVADRFNIKPLLRSTTFEHSAYVIALSEKGLRLIEVFADLPPEEIEDASLPSGTMYSELANRDRRDNSESGGEHIKRNILKFSRLLDTALAPLLQHSDIPVIVMAAQPIASIFHNQCSAQNLLPQIITGSPDRVPLHEIASQAREVLQKHYQTQVEDLREHYQLRFQSRRASDKLEEVARAATFAAVETLYIDIDSSLMGAIDEVSGVVDYSPAQGVASYNLVSEITRRALLSGAKVMALRKDDMPSPADVAATLRFPI